MPSGGEAEGPPLGAVRVKFDDPAYESIHLRSIARALQMRDRSGAYGTSSAEQQEVGLLGEEAVRMWLHGLGFNARSIAEGEGTGNSGGDVAVRFTRNRQGFVTSGIATIEVKTARIQHWARYERELNARQFKRMTCDAIVWCSTRTYGSRRIVDIMGWLPRFGLKIVEAPPTSARQPQVRVIDELRAPSGLADWLIEERPTPAQWTSQKLSLDDDVSHF